MNKRVIQPSLTDNAILNQELTPGERKVLGFFNEHLPDKWEIYIHPHMNGLRPDFVLLNPQGGIAVFEVRDWDINGMKYFTQEDQWDEIALWEKKNGDKFCIQNENPISQVNLYKKEIFNLYCPRLQQRFGWSKITAGVIFPFAQTDQVKNLLNLFRNVGFGNYYPISGIQEISDGDLEKIFPDVNCRDSDLMTKELADDLRGWLVEPDFSSIRKSPLELNKKLRRWVNNNNFKNRYRRIKGPAGSGKSYVLAARAARLASEGKSVLIATFNITLWHYLRDLILREMNMPGRMENIEFVHFHGWCKRVCYEVGWDCKYNSLMKSISNKEEKEILNVTLPKLAKDAIEQFDVRKYDAILVDEGQDYLPEWWNVLRKVCKQDGEMLLVRDATQDLYGTAKAWTNDEMKEAGFSGSWKKLSVSYRLPPDAISLVRDFAENYLDKEVIDIPEFEPDLLSYPCFLRWVQCSAKDSGKICSDEVISLMEKTGKNSANVDITILADDMKFGNGVVNRLSKDGIETIDTFGDDHRRKKMAFYMESAQVKATTIHSFKGWESRFIVIYITSDIVSEESLNAIYAGLTRLKRSEDGSWLTVVCCEPYFNHYGQKFPDYVPCHS